MRCLPMNSSPMIHYQMRPSQENFSLLPEEDKKCVRDWHSFWAVQSEAPTEFPYV